MSDEHTGNTMQDVDPIEATETAIDAGVVQDPAEMTPAEAGATLLEKLAQPIADVLLDIESNEPNHPGVQVVLQGAHAHAHELHLKYSVTIPGSDDASVGPRLAQLFAKLIQETL